MSIKGDAYLRDTAGTGIKGTSAQADKAISMLNTLPAWTRLSYDNMPDAATIQNVFPIVLGFVTGYYKNAANSMYDALKGGKLDSSDAQHPGTKAQVETLATAMRNNSLFDPTWKARKASEVAKKVGAGIARGVGGAVGAITGQQELGNKLGKLVGGTIETGNFKALGSDALALASLGAQAISPQASQYLEQAQGLIQGTKKAADLAGLPIPMKGFESVKELSTKIIGTASPSVAGFTAPIGAILSAKELRKAERAAKKAARAAEKAAKKLAKAALKGK